MCASAFAMSCVQDVVPGVPEAQEETVVFTASVDAATKTTLNGVNTEWVAGDKITIHNGTKGFVFTAKSSGAKSDFTYTGSDFSGEKFMAVYPSGTYTADVDKKTVKVNIPTWQQAKVGSWDANAAVGVAYSENTSLAFKNATALLEFQVNTDKVTHVVFHGNNAEAITGDANVTLTDEGTKVEVLPTDIIKDGKKIADKGSWVEIYAWHSESDKYFKKGQTYYAAVAPQVLSKGVTVKVRIDEGDELEVKKSTKSLTLQPSHIYNLGTLEYTPPATPEWAIPGAYNGWSTSAAMTKEGDFYVAKNVTKLNSKDEGFKIMNNGTWLGFTGGVSVNQWNTLGGDGNIFVNGASASTKYDVYVYPSKRMFYVTTAGSAAPTVPNVEVYRFYVQNKVGWTTLNFYAWGGYASSGWPGDKMTLEATVGSYGACKYVEIPKDKNIVNFIINNGSKQTKDLVVSGNSKVVKQSNGDYVYILESADVK